MMPFKTVSHVHGAGVRLLFIGALLTKEAEVDPICEGWDKTHREGNTAKDTR